MDAVPYELSTDLDIDKWGYGRDPHGRLDGAYLRASYPHVEVTDLMNVAAAAHHARRARKILHEHFPTDHEKQPNWLQWAGVIFFTDKEDAEVFRALLYIY